MFAHWPYTGQINPRSNKIFQKKSLRIRLYVLRKGSPPIIMKVKNGPLRWSNNSNFSNAIIFNFHGYALRVQIYPSEKDFPYNQSSDMGRWDLLTSQSYAVGEENWILEDCLMPSNGKDQRYTRWAPSSYKWS